MKRLLLLEYRKSLKLTQKQVASMLNITQSGYSLWEQGKRFPNYEQILQLCGIFKCSPNDLFGIEGAHSVTVDPLFEEYKKLRAKIKE